MDDAMDITGLKSRILSCQEKKNVFHKPSPLVYVTGTTKTYDSNNDNDLSWSSSNGLHPINSFLKNVLHQAKQLSHLTHRVINSNSCEMVEVTRLKSDYVTKDGIPGYAARLLIKSDGLCQFCLVTGKIVEQKAEMISDVFDIMTLPFMSNLNEEFVFCEGLSKDLAEIKCYELPFQFSQDYPYPHVRSKNCYIWYKQSHSVSIRERKGMDKPRCLPCKRYLCVITKWCRLKQKKVMTSSRDKCKTVKPVKKICLKSQKRRKLTPAVAASTQMLEKSSLSVNEYQSKCLPRVKEVALLALGASVSALYDSSDDVVVLTANNFNNMVINSDDVWLVEFYAPWCGHCKSLAPEWKKAASALKGIVKVGAVDMDVHASVGGPYNVRGFPTIKVFANKQSPQDYNGARSAPSIVDEAMRAAQKLAKERLSGGGGSRSSGGGGGGSSSGNTEDVITLTDSNFEKEVLNSKEVVLIEFYAPWCGHCQRLAPEWAKAATELKGKVKVAALDATVHTVTASRFKVQGYPTIKFFRSGMKNYDSAEDFQGGRTAGDIVAFALDLHAEAIDPPEILELTSNDLLKANCEEKPLCVVSFLPDILDTGASGRNDYIGILKELGEKYKKKMWGWIWTAPGVHPKLEEALGVGGFGYPAMAVVNVRKKVYVILRGSFGRDGIDELLKSIAVGRGRTEKLRDGLPTIKDAEPWDGKDGVLPVEEDIDLSDVDLDDTDSDKKEEL